VVIEQRGYSLRGDRLELPTKAWPLDRPASIQADTDATIALARQAAAAYPDRDLAPSITTITTTGRARSSPSASPRR
jgi:hypothetical protein